MFLSLIPVTVDGPLEKLDGVLRLPELSIGRLDLGSHPADAGVALEGVGPSLRFLVHHLQHIPSAPLRCGQLLKTEGIKGDFKKMCALKVQTPDK